MINILKFKKEDGAKLFFFSDLHYSHSKLNKSRGFRDDEEQKKVLLENCNNSLNNDSILFLLGDTVLGAGEKSLETFTYLIQTLNYKELYIMPGNHSAGYRSIFNNSEDKTDKFYRLPAFFGARHPKTVYFIPNYYEIFVGSQHLVLSHYPILSFNGASKDSWHLFGHSHNNLTKNNWIKDNYLTGKVLDVGFESIKKPISFDSVKEMMDSRKKVVFDHHGDDTNIR